MDKLYLTRQTILSSKGYLKPSTIVYRGVSRGIVHTTVALREGQHLCSSLKAPVSGVRVYNMHIAQHRDRSSSGRARCPRGPGPPQGSPTGSFRGSPPPAPACLCLPRRCYDSGRGEGVNRGAGGRESRGPVFSWGRPWARRQGR